MIAVPFAERSGFRQNPGISMDDAQGAQAETLTFNGFMVFRWARLAPPGIALRKRSSRRLLIVRFFLGWVRSGVSFLQNVRQAPDIRQVILE